MMRPRNAPPNAHIGMPIIGTYLEIAKNPVSFIKQCYDKYGEVYTTPMMHKNLTFLIGPEASTPFFKSNDEVMSQNEVYGFMKPVFGPNIVYDAEPKKRTQQMQHTAGALRSARLKIYVPKIERETIEYLKRWGESGEVNLLDALSELTIMSASRCLHGDEVRENMFDEVSRIYCDLDKGITPISFFFPTVPIPSHIRRDRARVEMVKIFSKVIKDRRAKCGNTDDFTDILQVFIDLEYKDGSRLIDDEIVGLLIALLFAGQHTSSITSTWTTMFLLFNKKCLEKVMEEQRVVLPDLSASLDFELVGKMEYLQNCVKETLRMYPPLIMLMRYCKQDIETTSKGKTYTIPKGDIVITSPAVSGRLPEVFKDPDSFDPDRFSPERNEQKTPYSYLGFGGGMHACLGQQFGLLQVKTLMSVMLRNFDIEPVDKEFPEPDYTAMVVGPHTHLMVRYKKKPGAFI
eukprot:CAMPEP_0182417958 /NCGR_PEP_ID=MMETSP1167-20130531/2417_1 /TAXON_ID=2988 /ORGANISM="Mallomonas Sp, Strain CCMP3275" /LENGTH=459 /DNA_ID=CAMNT_0024591869 /DNA_START=172 /DNA_END=1551 /DNA_ORIENTATION=-